MLFRLRSDDLDGLYGSYEREFVRVEAGAKRVPQVLPVWFTRLIPRACGIAAQGQGIHHLRLVRPEGHGPVAAVTKCIRTEVELDGDKLVGRVLP